MVVGMNLHKVNTSDTSVNAMNCILRPFQKAEAASLDEAAEMAGITKLTARVWVNKYGLGRIVGSKTLVSRVAWAAYLDGDTEALAEYQRGCRTTPKVAAYFRRFGIPLVENVEVDS